jgi:hypothetical protein
MLDVFRDGREKEPEWDSEGAVTWLRIIVAVRTLGTPTTKVRH